jgi:hypothetical protein
MPINLDADSTSSPTTSVWFESTQYSDRFTTSRPVNTAIIELRKTLESYLAGTRPIEHERATLFDEIAKVWAARINNSTELLKNGQRPSYDWRRRLAMLREWKGNSEEHEASRVSEASLILAERLAAYFESRQITLFGNDPVKAVLAPLASGGVHLEFNIRTSVVHHLEVDISSTGSAPFPILRTIEKSNGEICDARELPHATELELWATLEAFLESSRRLLR